VKILFIDKDGTFVKTISGEPFVNQPADQTLIEGSRAAIVRYVQHGWTTVIISNQGGVSQGYKSLEDAIDEMLIAMNLITQIDPLSGVPCSVFAEGYLCPCMLDIDDHCWVVSNEPAIKPIALGQIHFPEIPIAGFRKPNPGMIQAAIATWREQGNEIREQDCLFVGDRPEDEQAAAAANVPFMWAEQWRSQE
jgi:D-glycero-D-manno-heptose 1,7-bisphosphate phosphatase